MQNMMQKFWEERIVKQRNISYAAQKQPIKPVLLDLRKDLIPMFLTHKHYYCL